MGDLRELGVTVERGTVEGEPGVTELRYTLPKSTNVQASFTFEGLTKRFVKIFKKEIQTGDQLFDQNVHINTETEEATTKLLESEELRTVIEGVVGVGGAVEIDGASVKIELRDRTDLEPTQTKYFFEALLR